MSATLHDDASKASHEARPEAPLVLDTAPPRTLGFRDQAAFWANLGVSLIGFSSAATVMVNGEGKNLALAASITAIVVGTVVGTLMLALAALIGARTGAPAMAVLRGLFGTRLSYVPTVLNILQCIGWGVYELIVITQGAQALYGGIPRWVYVVLAGLLTTTMTIWPLGSIAALRRYVAVAVGVSMLYFTVQLARHGVQNPGGGNWNGFLQATDYVVAVSISFVPLAADYTRHSKSGKGSFWGTFTGYTVAQVWCYVVGAIALTQVGGDPNKIFSTFTGLTAGWIFFLVLVLREADQSFANVYSTAMSIHNLFPKVDRRWLTLGIGAVVTACALSIDGFTNTYYAFLGLIGAFFVPLLAVLAVDFFLGRGRDGWDMSETAPTRWLMLLPWALGFVLYELINPATLPYAWWTDFWANAQKFTHIHPTSWTSASLFSFLIAGGVTLALAPALRRRGA
ncbi:purine-cytosine permease family protein [Streptacidiphilus jiangxiensis]|uniref:Putative hydroxymethylpyrimidine transporter CytX n=1 Tax=Streptacidiphilus jiangxiensis TaxID=235985 RepID=A0A1H7J2Z9_STRJI|nr:cytosine permease [Streptacidiphilus jiangxiensis]SEK68340.1 putative hydroxymethylpyrimidine transporter CytX [Streptacidiphilus jiangxiensis]